MPVDNPVLRFDNPVLRVDNPVLRGWHPDPSICRVGDDYYLATSTFTFFPGLSLHHSRDLVHWRPIGAALDRPEQLALDGLGVSQGIYAPTIRHHDGVFFLITTLVGERTSRTFLVTATDVHGPWSDPVWLDDAPGFDPSLLFDDDGRVWCCGTFLPDPAAHPDRTVVWLQELDRETLTLVGERSVIWSGAAVEARWVEGPHLYRIGDGYLLVTAEGGTEWEHAVVVARAAHITGPYERHPGNPVLTARDRGRGAAVVALGHADLVQTPAGDWWAVLIGVRAAGGDWWATGRETFLLPVQFVDGWPRFDTCGSDLSGGPVPLLPAHPWPREQPVDGFDDPTLGPEWMTLGTPRVRWHSLTERRSHLRLAARAVGLQTLDNPSFVARRVREAAWSAHTVVDLAHVSASDAAGLALFAGAAAHLRLEVTGGAHRRVQAVLVVDGVESVEGTLAMGDGSVLLSVEADGRAVRLRARQAGEAWREVAGVDVSPLSPAVSQWFVGLVVGVFAVGPGGTADFDWFAYADH